MTFPAKERAAPTEEAAQVSQPKIVTRNERGDRYLDTISVPVSLPDCAIYYASIGWPVFLMGENSKLPRIPSDPEKAKRQGWERPGHGHLDATTDLIEISRWWKKLPRGNIGMPTGAASGFLVVDIDGLDAAKKFDTRGDVLAPLIQKSGRGWHLFYAWTDDCRGIRNSAGLVSEKIDIRAEGGYVALAPSVHPSGCAYSWQNWDVEPSPPPAWLIDRLKPKTVPRQTQDAGYVPSGFITGRARKALETMARRIETAPFGEQEKTLAAGAWLAKRLVAEGKADALYAERVITNAGLLMSSCEGMKPWRAVDIERKVSQVMRRTAA